MVLTVNELPETLEADKHTDQSVSILPATGERVVTQVWNETTIEHLHRYGLALDACAGKDVLDVASGEGYGANLLAGVSRSVIGVDISAEAVHHAQVKYAAENLKYVQGTADALPILSNTIDVVVSFETIEHHSKHDEMMVEVKRVLRPDGVLLISSPDKLYYSDLPKFSNKYHVKELYKDEFTSLIRQHFVNVEVLAQKASFCSVIVPEQHPANFVEYQGNYNQLQSSGTLLHPLYNLCLASDSSLPNMYVSIFNEPEILQRMYVANAEVSAHLRTVEEELQVLYRSRSFRLGRALTAPVRKLLGR